MIENQIKAAVELKQHYTIVIVTHNMQQALRISDRTAFFLLGEGTERLAWQNILILSRSGSCWCSFC